MLKLSDKQSEDPPHSPLQTFGQRQAIKPVGVLTEIDLEESVSRGQAGLIPTGYIGDANITTSHAENFASEGRMDQPNAIYATREYAVSYVRLPTNA
jgi:hypothetical protein